MEILQQCFTEIHGELECANKNSFDCKLFFPWIILFPLEIKLDDEEYNVHYCTDMNDLEIFSFAVF